jgi:hypothetical protein
MRIERLVQWTRDPDHDFLRELAIFNRSITGPDLLFLWQPRPIYGDRTRPKIATDQDPRWEIWCELVESRHPDADNRRWRSDLELDGRWYRKLQSWAQRDANFNDVGFAPLDWDPLGPLRMADTWKSRTFYEDMIDDPAEAEEAALMKHRKNVIREGGRYYKDFDRTLISPGGKHTGDWRYRYR